MAKKKIAFVFLSNRQMGGMERRYLNLFLHLKNQGVDVSLLCTKESYYGFRDIGILSSSNCVEFIDYEGSQLKLFRIIRRIISVFILVKKSQPYEKIFFVCNPGVLLYIITFFHKLLPKYSFVMVHSILKDYNKRYVARIVRYSEKVDCLSEDILQHNIDFLTRDEDKRKLSLAPCSFIDYSKIINSQNKNIDVTFLGRFSEGKGIELIEQIDNDLKEINMHLCGFGDMIPKLNNAKVYPVESGFEVLSRTKVFLSIQKHENYPSQALLEAMASGCAIIATDVGLTRKILDESCCIFIKYDADELISAIKLLLNEPKLMKKLGLNARNKALNEHNISIYANYFINEFM